YWISGKYGLASRLRNQLRGRLMTRSRHHRPAAGPLLAACPFPAQVPRSTARRLLLPLALVVLACIAACDNDDDFVSALPSPTVVDTFPTADASDVPNTTVISAVFDHGMNPSTLTTQSFSVACDDGVSIDAEVSYDAGTRTATLTPVFPLPADVACTATVTSSAAAQNGQRLAADFTWTFATTVAASFVEQGKQIFRFETFGNEAFWTDTLRMHEVIATAVDPATALSVGLKVDAEALPESVVAGIQDGSISLTDPATTIALLKLDAVVGVKGTVENVN